MKISILTISAIIAITALPAVANESLFIQIPATIDPAAPIPPAVRNECAVDMLVGNYALSEIGRSGFSTQSLSSQEQAGNNKFVQLTVLSVHGFGGGAWSGSKSMSVRADLKQGTSTIASTVLSRSSTGGAFATFKGTCEILDRVSKAIGKDVAKWIAHPPTASSSERQTTEATKEAEK